MTNTGKHHTNVAGEWKKGHYLVCLSTNTIWKIHHITDKGSITLYRQLPFGGFQEDIDLYTRHELEDMGVINITALQRAVGRV